MEISLFILVSDYEIRAHGPFSSGFVGFPLRVVFLGEHQPLAHIRESSALSINSLPHVLCSAVVLVVLVFMHGRGCCSGQLLCSGRVDVRQKEKEKKHDSSRGIRCCSCAVSAVASDVTCRSDWPRAQYEERQP
jgi:hypothetical protein